MSKKALSSARSFARNFIFLAISFALIFSGNLNKASAAETKIILTATKAKGNSTNPLSIQYQSYGRNGTQGPILFNGTIPVVRTGLSTTGALGPVRGEVINGTNSDVIVLGNANSSSAPGATGKSAYELAVANGFKGTVTQWLAS